MNIKLIFFICLIFFSSLTYGKTNSIHSLTWEMMEGLNIDTGQISSELIKLENKTVEISGFMVPLNMEVSIDKIKEFLLVSNPLSCYHIPPPPLNQIIFVKMTKAIPINMDYRGVSITGKLQLSTKTTDEGFITFELLGTSAKEAHLEFDDPFEEFLF